MVGSRSRCRCHPHDDRGDCCTIDAAAGAAVDAGGIDGASLLLLAAGDEEPAALLVLVAGESATASSGAAPRNERPFFFNMLLAVGGCCYRSRIGWLAGRRTCGGWGRGMGKEGDRSRFNRGCLWRRIPRIGHPHAFEKKTAGLHIVVKPANCFNRSMGVGCTGRSSIDRARQEIKFVEAGGWLGVPRVTVGRQHLFFFSSFFSGGWPTTDDERLQQTQCMHPRSAVDSNLTRRTNRGENRGGWQRCGRWCDGLLPWGGSWVS